MLFVKLFLDYYKRNLETMAHLICYYKTIPNPLHDCQVMLQLQYTVLELILDYIYRQAGSLTIHRP